MDDLDSEHQVTVEIVYEDEDVIQIEAVVRGGEWRGRAKAYTVPTELHLFAERLLAFAAGKSASADFNVGEDNGIGLIVLRFYRVDRSGHTACHVRLASGDVSMGHRPEEVFRLSLELHAETWAIERFARQLSVLASTQSGKAILDVQTV